MVWSGWCVGFLWDLIVGFEESFRDVWVCLWVWGEKVYGGVCWMVVRCCGIWCLYWWWDYWVVGF